MKYIYTLLIPLFIISCNKSTELHDHLNLRDELVGSWVAKAFNGELRESWSLNKSGWMEQQGYYIENGDTSYSAQTQIQKVNDDIILFSVIKNSNPKIFKVVEKNEGMFLFKNSDYKNPYEVKYEFLSSDKYRRTITGYEGDSLVTYIFDFNKQNK